MINDVRFFLGRLVIIIYIIVITEFEPKLILI